MYTQKKGLLMIVILISTEIVTNLLCGKMPNGVKPEPTGSVELQIQLIDGIAKAAALKQTNFDSLIVEVSGNDMASMRFASTINPQSLFFIDTISRVPVGNERIVNIKTINRAGEVIHEDSSGARTVRIDPNVTTVLQTVLVPVRGSIYIQIGGVPTSVDSVGGVFTAEDGRRWAASVGRSPKVFFSIDGIPHNTRGVLLAAAWKAGGDTLYKAQCDVRVNSRITNSVKLSFSATPGGMAVTGTIELPGATVVSGSLGSMVVADSERGDLIITEIMYAANDSEYIEIYNPQENDLYFDSLFIDIDGTKRLFTDISIGARSYFVFGRQNLPWTDVAHSVKSALDLSGNGNWITLISKEGVVIDQVIFTGGSNVLEWPRINGRASICLKSDFYTAAANNLGRNWAAATTPIEGAPGQLGTPHRN